MFVEGCVDYSLIELLDEINGAPSFSKFDLNWGITRLWCENDFPQRLYLHLKSQTQCYLSSQILHPPSRF